MKPNQRLTVTISPVSFIYLAIVVAAVAVIWNLLGVVILILASIIFAAALNPSVAQLTKLKIPRPVAVVILYVAVFAALGLMIYLTAPTISQQIQSLVNNLPRINDRVQESLASQPILSLAYSKTSSALFSRSDVIISQIGQTAVTFVSSLFGFVTLLVLTFYFLLNGRGIMKSLVKYVPSKERQKEVTHIALESSVKLGHWIRGQLLMCLIVFVVSFIVLSLLGVPYALTLALFAGVLQFIPFVGAVVGAIPAIAVALTVSPVKAIFVIAFFVIFQLILGNILAPQIMKKAVGVSAVVILIAALIGFSLLGVLGVLLAVPVAAVIDVVFDSLGQGYVKEKINEATHE